MKAQTGRISLLDGIENGGFSLDARKALWVTRIL